MKFIASLFLVFCLGFDLGRGEDDEYRCDPLLLKTLKINDNPFVKPGEKKNKDLWYDSVTWEKIPVDYVTLTYKVTLQYDGSNQSAGEESLDLFDADTNSSGGSICNIMRYALGIPRSGLDPVLGTKRVDSQMFSSKPCTAYFTNYRYYGYAQYTYEITVTVKENDQLYKIVTGTLVRPAN